MLFKIFYQENGSIVPRRESTLSLYVDIEAKTKRDGIIKIRDLIAKKTDYHIEYIDPLSKAAEQYEKETTNFSLTTF